MDHAATTYMDERVKEAMEKYWIENFGNPSSLHSEGRKARIALENAREQIASTLNTRYEEIIFTNGGTESDNLAIFGVVRFLSELFKDLGKRPHIITTKIEHHAVLRPCQVLEREGMTDVTYLEVGKNGIVDPKDVEASLRPETVLVSVMYANNEVGTIQPIQEITKVIKDFKKKKLEIENSLKIENLKFKIDENMPYFHCDACQAAGYLELDVKKLGVDLLTLNGSKNYGPKGIGLLYAKKGVQLSPLMYGGAQERAIRPGTENVPAIIGLAEALKNAQEDREKESERLTELRDSFVERLLKEIPDTTLNGSKDNRLPNNINVSFAGVEGESILLYLDEAGIACSTGSACTSESLDPSHVIMALGGKSELAHSSIRFSLGKENTKEDVDYVMSILPGIIEKLRSISAIR